MNLLDLEVACPHLSVRIHNMLMKTDACFLSKSAETDILFPPEGDVVKSVCRLGGGKPGQVRSCLIPLSRQQRPDIADITPTHHVTGEQ